MPGTQARRRQANARPQDDSPVLGPPADAVESPTDATWRLDWAIFVVKLLIYAVGQALACYIEFGAVFFSMSLLTLIWCSLDDRKRSRNEMSAYSVFNDDCQAIEGSVTADQLQRQLMGGGVL